ncbi:MAG: riboflavin synthase, partial [Candidatus Marithrix sp.]|nr:riboflavin synthase [Candidatus Marithrix sp.]
SKGSICVDGISLTVNNVQGIEFNLNIVPHTQERTTLAKIKIGQQVNLEVDIIARYLEKLLLNKKESIDNNFLQKHGFS